VNSANATLGRLSTIRRLTTSHSSTGTSINC
jgi:hypothetical protein